MIIARVLSIAALLALGGEALACNPATGNCGIAPQGPPQMVPYGRPRPQFKAYAPVRRVVWGAAQFFKPTGYAQPMRAVPAPVDPRTLPRPQLQPQPPAMTMTQPPFCPDCQQRHWPH